MVATPGNLLHIPVLLTSTLDRIHIVISKLIINYEDILSLIRWTLSRLTADSSNVVIYAFNIAILLIPLDCLSVMHVARGIFNIVLELLIEWFLYCVHAQYEKSSFLSCT